MALTGKMCCKEVAFNTLFYSRQAVGIIVGQSQKNSACIEVQHALQISNDYFLATL
jgi:hypothetical protein